MTENSLLSFEKLHLEFNCSNFVRSTCAQIEKDFALAGIELSISMDNPSALNDIKKQLIDCLDFHLFKGRVSLPQLCYQIDIPENWMNENNSNHEFLEELAQIIIRREAYKVFLRTQFSR